MDFPIAVCDTDCPKPKFAEVEVGEPELSTGSLTVKLVEEKSVASAEKKIANRK